MANIEELNLDQLEQVSGGLTAPINTGDEQNAGVWRKWENIGVKRADDSLENGTTVNIIGAPKFHKGKGRHYVEIAYTTKSKMKTGWVASSIVGLTR